MNSIPDEQPGQDIPPDPAADQAAESSGTAPPEAAAAASPDAAGGESSLADDAMNLLSEHKGKLAIGVAATLGLMVYYGWREKRLAKTDPEEYARLQRIRAIMRHSDEAPKTRTRKAAAASGAATQADNAADPAADPETKPGMDSASGRTDQAS